MKEWEENSRLWNYTKALGSHGVIGEVDRGVSDVIRDGISLVNQ